jgi:hypothetical protein
MLSSRLRRFAAALVVLGGLVAVAASSFAAVDPARMPLGDAQTATKPTRGKVFSCQTAFLQGAPSGTKDGPWINSDGTWNSTTKTPVGGSVAWPKATFSAKVASGKRTITSRDLPRGHRSGTFPVASGDAAHQYDANPNKIVGQDVQVTLPQKPTRAPAGLCVGTGPIGVLNDGVLLFGPLDSYGRDAVAHEILDRCGGHPDSQGVYHRHEVGACVLKGAKARATLVGYALDGFGIYVERDSKGQLLENSALDGCHGRSSRVPWNGRTTKVYHYVATAEFPYTLGCFRGKTVDAGVSIGGPGTGGVRPR